MNGAQVVGLLLILGATLFFILPALFATAFLAIFGFGAFSALGLYGLIPGGIMAFVGLYLFQHGGRNE